MLRESRTMNTITKPMLAGKCEQPEALSFPVLATPKLDGIRCLKIGGRALTRSFKPVSNRFAREWIEANLPDGVDGELMLRGGTFNATTSAIGRESGEPDFVFHVFDYVSDGCDVPYACRMQELARLPQWDRVEKVLPVEIKNAEELAAFEERCLAEGYEGVMVRDPAGPYMCGRSTEREGLLPHVGEGLVVPSAETYRKVTCLSRSLGIEWPHNVLRHSFISYRIAKVKNANEVALEAGNSPDIIFRHYRELATEDQADAWFAIRPSTAD